MSINIIICDDSGFARKQIARAIPSDLDAEVMLVADGYLALDAIRRGLGELLFLDLNMPGIDGYQVLETIRAEDLQTMVIVVSGDIQAQARERVKKLGALDFIKKPVTADDISGILNKYGLDGDVKGAAQYIDVEVDIWDCYREVANVAMGRAADLLSQLLNTFVEMPIPNVNMFEMSELKMALSEIDKNDSALGVCQGFVGSGIAGEGLVLFHQSSYQDLADLMNYRGELNEILETELLMDVACILIGSTLKGIAEQLDLNFSHGHPIVLGRHVKIGDLLDEKIIRWNKTLAIELGVNIENKNIKCELLLVFSEDSIEVLDERVALIME